MAIQQNFPAISPSLSLDFANVKALDPRITFTRASTATYYGTETAKAEENLLRFSQEFDNAAFFTRRATITANATTAPDGTTTAEQLTDDATSGTHVVSQSSTPIPANETFTYSVFLKKGTNDFAYILAADAVNGRCIAAVANLDTGAITQTFSGSATLTSSSITSVGNDWYRLAITGSVTIAPVRFFVGIAPAASGNTFSGNNENVGISYVGTGTTIFVWGAQLEQRSQVTAYTPTTTQPITNFIPVLESAASGVARFDHNPVTKESLGLLIEEQRTNLLLRSEEFDNAAWTKANATVTANTVIAPDGTLTGDKLVEDATNNTHRVFVTATVASGFRTGSLFLKAAERTFARLQIQDAGQIFINLLTGETSSPTSPSGISFSVAFAGNGWLRVSLTNNNVFTNPQFRIDTAIAINNATYQGDGFSGIFIWGAQLEAGAFATSYIPTVASQVTRAADSASMTGANFSSWYNAAEGTLFAEALSTSTTFAYVVQLRTGAISDIDNIYLRKQSNGRSFGAIRIGAAFAFSGEGAIWSSTQANKLAIAYKRNDIGFSDFGNSIVSSSNCLVPNDLTTLGIGVSQAGALGLNGHIKKLSYYPLRLSDTNLQALTS